MQNGRPPDSIEQLLRSQNPSTNQAMLQRLISSAALQQQQQQSTVQSRPDLTGQSSSSLPFRSFQSQNSPAASQSMHSKLLNTGNNSRPQTANYLSPHLSLTSTSQQNWRVNQPTSTSASHRFPTLAAGVSPAQSVSLDSGLLSSQKPSTPQISHPPDQASTIGTPQPKRSMSPSRLAAIGELLKKTDEDLYELLKKHSPNDILSDFGDFENIDDDVDPSGLLNEEIAARTTCRQEFKECSAEYDKVS